MKKFVSLMLALVLVFSLSATVFAVDGKGNITVSNATIGKTYNIYKIFDATYDATDGKKAVSYTVEKNSAGYEAVVSEEGQKYFVYSSETGIVAKKEGVNDSELIAYLTGLVTAEGSKFTKAKDPVTAESATVNFTELDYGYYLITSDLGVAVTITSNVPSVTVIDKNQKPGIGFDKDIMVGDEADEDEKDSAAIGDKVDYRIAFTATNYDGDKHIQYYQVIDTLGAALSADLDTFKIVVGSGEKAKELTKGWLLNNTTETSAVTEGKIGNWEGTDSAKDDIDEAEWYLVYLGNNQFRITMPWQTNHDIKGQTGAWTISFEGTDHASKYESPIDVVVTYSVYVEPNAVIGGGTHDVLTNSANASWTSANETGTTPTETVLTETFGIGLLKDDGATGKNLAGAQFRIWKNKECTEHVYIIPTNIEGVYMRDSKGTAAEGQGAQTSRDVYKNYLEAYLGEDYANKQDNMAITPVNGKIVILGLDAGTYYLQEVKAPDGYNALTAPVEIKAGEGQTPFYVFADSDGKVADLRDPDVAHSRNTYNVTHTTVHNSQGVELPSTGGEGTMMLITLGTILTIGFAIFLITNKKMSIYND